ncbi:hypothetical protein KJ570_04085 [Patescibacteria group bacterium]|nr:hypothetical protein [Patescibacteria group bacterium]MBU2036419.1 hypothetical protein [Patescibacteria group bacterium]
MRKIASLVGVGALILASTGAVFAYDVKVINKGDARQEITTMAAAISGDVKLSVKDNKHFGRIKLGGGLMTTGDVQAFSTTRAIANQFTTDVESLSAKVINKGEAAEQTLITDASAFSGDIKVKVKDNRHFGKIKIGGGEKTTGFAGADSLTKAWANIFDVKVH